MSAGEGLAVGSEQAHPATSGRNVPEGIAEPDPERQTETQVTVDEFLLASSFRASCLTLAPRQGGGNSFRLLCGLLEKVAASKLGLHEGFDLVLHAEVRLVHPAQPGGTGSGSGAARASNSNATGGGCALELGVGGVGLRKHLVRDGALREA